MKNAASSCEGSDIAVSEHTNEEQHDNKRRTEPIDGNMNSSLDACSMTQHNSETEVSRTQSCNSDDEFGDISSETCFITKYSSNCESSTVEDECCENETLATWKQLPDNCEETDLDQEKVSCVLTNTNDSSLSKTCVEKPLPKTEERKADLFFGYSCEEPQHESRLKPDEAYSIQKPPDSSSCSPMFVAPEEKLITTSTQKHSSLRYTSWIETEDSTVLGKDEGSNNNDTILRKQKAASSCATEAGNVPSIENKDNLEADKDENIDSLSDRYYEGYTLSENSSLTTYNENIALEKNAPDNGYFLGNYYNGAIKMGINENSEESEVENYRLKHRYYLKSSQSVREWGSNTEKDLSEDILGLSSIKENSVSRRKIRFAITPLQNGNIKQTSSLLKRNAEIKLAVTAPRNKAIEQIQAFKWASTSTQNKTIGCDSQALSGRSQQTVPVIDVSFQKAERSRLVKPSFTAFTNVWKASNAFREKQRQRRISTGQRRGSDVMFSLVSFLTCITILKKQSCTPALN